MDKLLRWWQYETRKQTQTAKGKGRPKQTTGKDSCRSADGPAACGVGVRKEIYEIECR